MEPGVLGAAGRGARRRIGPGGTRPSTLGSGNTAADSLVRRGEKKGALRGALFSRIALGAMLEGRVYAVTRYAE